MKVFCSACRFLHSTGGVQRSFQLPMELTSPPSRCISPLPAICWPSFKGVFPSNSATLASRSLFPPVVLLQTLHGALFHFRVCIKTCHRHDNDKPPTPRPHIHDTSAPTTVETQFTIVIYSPSILSVLQPISKLPPPDFLHFSSLWLEKGCESCGLSWFYHTFRSTRTAIFLSQCLQYSFVPLLPTHYPSSHHHHHYTPRCCHCNWSLSWHPHEVSKDKKQPFYFTSIMAIGWQPF